MMRWCVLFATCCVMAFLVTADEETEDEKYAKWKKNLCENRNRTYNEEMNTCFQMEPQAVKDAMVDCVGRVLSSSEGNLVDMLEVACKEKSAYLKFKACNAEYESKEEYRSQMEVNQETIDCYEAVMAKYGLQYTKEQK